MKKQLLIIGCAIVALLVAAFVLTSCAKGNGGKTDENTVHDRIRFEVYALNDPTCKCENPQFDQNAARVTELKGVSIAHNSNWEQYPGGVTPWAKSITVPQDGGWNLVSMKAQAVDSTIKLIAVISRNGLRLIQCAGVGAVQCGTDL